MVSFDPTVLFAGGLLSRNGTDRTAPHRSLVLDGGEGATYDGIEQQLAAARARLARLSPRATYQEVLHRRAVLVDIRPEAQRREEGEVASCLAPLVIERNVLEWRLDPGQDAALPIASRSLRVIVLCQEGYTSSLAADSLQRIGIRRATDVDGGFRAWREAGLPRTDTRLRHVP